MAGISSSLTLYSGVLLDNTYEHTYASLDLLYSEKSYSFSDNSMYYIRPDKNTVRITCNNMSVGSGQNAFNLYLCNYISFINAQYENKRFYCFVTDIRYINDKTAEIDFEIDVMMTWLNHGGSNENGCEFEECFIERQHTPDDVIGKYTIDESVNLGEPIYLEQTMTNMEMMLCICVSGAFDGTDWEETFTFGSMLDTYTTDSLNRFYFDHHGIQYEEPSAGDGFNTVSQLLHSLEDAGKTSWIKMCYCYPKNSTAITIDRPTKLGEYLDYKPKNNKLLTYPYTACTVTNYEGVITDYAFEYIGDQITFTTKTSREDGSASLTPNDNYKKGSKLNMLFKTKFPVYSSSELTYSTYQAQLKAQMPSDIAGNVVIPATGSAASGALIGAGSGSTTGPMGALIGLVIGAAVGTGTYAAKAISGGEEAKMKGGTPTNINSGMLMLYNNTAQFGFYIKTIKKEFAKAIDGYFTKYGYKVNSLEIPDMGYGQGTPRLSWKYIKTIGCAIKGEAPASAVAKISSIMDNGITFWSKPEIGEYN